MRRVPLLIAGCALLVLAACSSGGKGAASPALTVTATPVASSGIQHVSIQGLQSDKFDVTTVYAKPGQLAIEFLVPGPTPHNFEVEGIQHSKLDLISNGQKSTETITISQPGTYTYVCTIHNGMQGKIVVAA